MGMRNSTLWLTVSLLLPALGCAQAAPLGLSGSALADVLQPLTEHASQDPEKVPPQYLSENSTGRRGGRLALPATFLFFEASGCLSAAVIPEQFGAVDGKCLAIEGAPGLAAFAAAMSHSIDEVRATAGSGPQEPMVLVLIPPISLAMVPEDRRQALRSDLDVAMATFQARFPGLKHVWVEPFPTPAAGP